ncbi:MAG: hypothetical protein HKN16_12350, partial [Saprospiraceae bacterium]|nr:hypothetical protein [Saprospiraceae bacterium]
MEDSKNIERLFRNADEKLSERPPGRAWDNLSSKLDADQPEKTTRVVPLLDRLPGWKVAASILVLVGMFALLLDRIPIGNKQLVDASADFYLEDIPLEDVDNGFYALAVKAREFYTDSPALANRTESSSSRLRLAERKNRYADQEEGRYSPRASQPKPSASEWSHQPTEMIAEAQIPEKAVTPENTEKDEVSPGDIILSEKIASLPTSTDGVPLSTPTTDDQIVLEEVEVTGSK